MDHLLDTRRPRPICKYITIGSDVKVSFETSFSPPDEFGSIDFSAVINHVTSVNVLCLSILLMFL